MTEIIAIDPGTTESGYVTWDNKHIINKNKESNEIIIRCLRNKLKNATLKDFKTVLVIEKINPYTMGKTTRDTLLWSGRFQESWEGQGGKVVYISRNDVRIALTGAGGPKINDKVIKQALIDRFAYGQKNYGKGTKKAPGFFYGFRADIWQAFALAVAYFEIYEK